MVYQVRRPMLGMVRVTDTSHLCHLPLLSLFTFLWIMCPMKYTRVFFFPYKHIDKQILMLFLLILTNVNTPLLGLQTVLT